mgnify:CR=1 FL=1
MTRPLQGERAAVPGNSPVSAAILYASEHLDEPLSNHDLARACGLSVRVFERLFQTTYNTTPHLYVRQLRDMKASVDTAKLDATGMALYGAGRHQDSLMALKRVLKRDTSNAVAFLYAGRCHLALERFDVAQHVDAQGAVVVGGAESAVDFGRGEDESPALGQVDDFFENVVVASAVCHVLRLVDL